MDTEDKIVTLEDLKVVSDIVKQQSEEIDHIKDMTSEAEQRGDYAGYHLGFYIDENGDLCQKEE